MGEKKGKKAEEQNPKAVRASVSAVETKKEVPGATILSAAKLALKAKNANVAKKFAVGVPYVVPRKQLSISGVVQCSLITTPRM
eukprot:8501223-Ditylum_brightwellii.AAC.1